MAIQRNTERAASGRVLLPITMALVACFIPLLVAEMPPWWGERGVIPMDASGQPADARDYAAANQGQLKNVALAAYEEILNRVPQFGDIGPDREPDPGIPNDEGSDGWRLRNLVSQWVEIERSSGRVLHADLDALGQPAGTYSVVGAGARVLVPSASANDFAAINIGQVKATARIFYDRLIEIGYADSYPWAAPGPATKDHAMANLGQLKNLFAFDLARDTDGNGLPDWWEMKHFQHLGVDPDDDADGDGYTAREEYNAGSSPQAQEPLRITGPGVPVPVTVKTGRSVNLTMRTAGGIGSMSLAVTEGGEPLLGSIPPASGGKDVVFTYKAGHVAGADSVSFTATATNPATNPPTIATATATIAIKVEPEPLTALGDGSTYWVFADTETTIRLSATGGSKPVGFVITEYPSSNVGTSGDLNDPVFDESTTPATSTAELPFTVTGDPGSETSLAFGVFDSAGQWKTARLTVRIIRDPYFWIEAHAPGTVAGPGPVTGPITAMRPNIDNDDGVSTVPGQPEHQDNSDNIINPNDDDIVKVNIGFYPGARLRRVTGGTITITLPASGFKIYTAPTGGTVLGDRSYTLDYEHPSGPLAGLLAPGGMDLYVETAPGTLTSGDIKITSNLRLADGSAGFDPEAKHTLLPVDIAIDANRDGTIASGETASQAKPFRFWINNDDDPNTLGDDVETAMKKDELSPPGIKDWFSAITLGHIDGVRDLEDFTRLHLTLPSDIVQKAKAGEVQVGFKWTNGSGPRIRVYKAQGNTGDEKFLFYKYEANLQVDSDHRFAVADVKGSQTAFLPSSYWQGVAAGTTKLNFIFEGCVKGTAKLTTVIKLGSSAEVEGAGVWIKLMDVQEMFERGKVAEPMSGPDDVPDPWVTTEPLTFQAKSDLNGNTFQADPDETKQYIIHVHGWRMSYNEAQTWANTSFKRFWQLGYKGRFAFFSWPTFSGATSALDGYLTYNKSEYRAWLSGAALKSYVASLPSGYTKNIMAHSMGNVVVGSAFRQGMGGIANYSLLNAAMAAQAYDPAQIDFPDRKTPDTDNDPAVRTKFGLSSKFSGITAKTTNFYLEDDFATKAWSFNHTVNKPQRLLDPLEPLYGYSNGGFTVGTVTHKLAQLVTLSHLPFRGVTMIEEAMAFVSRTRSLPAGRTPTNLGMRGGWKIDMSRMVFGSEHSAEWIWSLQRTFSVWRQLLDSFDLIPKPMP